MDRPTRVRVDLAMARLLGDGSPDIDDDVQVLVAEIRRLYLDLALEEDTGNNNTAYCESLLARLKQAGSRAACESESVPKAASVDTSRESK